VPCFELASLSKQLYSAMATLMIPKEKKAIELSDDNIKKFFPWFPYDIELLSASCLPTWAPCTPSLKKNGIIKNSTYKMLLKRFQQQKTVYF